MIDKIYIEEDVLTMAKKRVKNIFETANRVMLNVSGGKDSICLNDIVYKMCINGEVDKNKLEINFTDEEAIYPCVEKITMDMRTQWMLLGVTFNWWCIQVKHFNCFNMLTNDETFICWDETKKDVWVRPMPPFARTSHPALVERKDSYQMFFDKYAKGAVRMTGIRVSESLQRRNNIAAKKSQEMLFPIYDWTDKDVWKYILDNNLNIPNAYIYMYQVGMSKRQMRISQFFSIDTATNLVQMCEFYPELFDKICKREPNAYMSMLYYDTELFRNRKSRGNNKKVEEENWKEKFYQLIKESWRYESVSQKKNYNLIMSLLARRGEYFNDAIYKDLCGVLIAGDPKQRTIRGITHKLHCIEFEEGKKNE